MADTNNIIEAIQNGNADQVKSLLEAQPEVVNTTETNGYTALHLAAQQGNGEIIKLLLEHGADINAIAADGQTPMEVAIKHGHDAAMWFSGG